jgi:hypothetical protein
MMNLSMRWTGLQTPETRATVDSIKYTGLAGKTTLIGFQCVILHIVRKSYKLSGSIGKNFAHIPFLESRGEFPLRGGVMSHPSSWGYLILGSGGQLSGCRGIARGTLCSAC